ncbi:MAG: hypothetical protein AMJ53_11160 [Gammaproteobacteria bacterium SG8_11]|nr:MAG: hypothetical protein AMJ53_11160 [Gammaproteobacteria bacterium SG8_11]
MVVQQSPTQRNQRIAAKALYATIGVACGSEIYGLLHQQSLRILTLEYGLLYATSFVLAFTFVWLTAKRNVQIAITKYGVEISHDEDFVRFGWYEVKRIKPPLMLRRSWLFELKNTKRIKIATNYFSRQQNREIKHLVANITKHNASNGEISHPRVVNSGRR